MKWFIRILIILDLLLALDLNILTFNIHALPSIIAGDKPKKRIKKIIKNINVYDIIFF